MKIEREIEKIITLDSDLRGQILFCCDLVENLPKYFAVLAEKLVFDEKTYRTIKLKGVISLICRPSKGFKGSGKNKSSKNLELSNVVHRTSRSSNFLTVDLKTVIDF